MALMENDPDLKDLDKKCSAMILSASGWRAVFAADGGEENAGAEITASHQAIAAAAAKVFADYVKNLNNEANPALIIGRDTRPTGKSIADTMIRALLTEKCRVLYAGVTAAPEIMAYAKSAPAQGFIYISASHNPIGHNGLKFGLRDGGVIPGSEAKILIEAFHGFMAKPDRVSLAAELVNSAEENAVSAVYAGESQVKTEALNAYLAFSKEIITDTKEKDAQDRLLNQIKDGVKQFPLGIVADFNGSARCASLDKQILPDIGVKFAFINGTAGKIAHRIVPEGESLDFCAEFLEKEHKTDPSAVMGYMPDCDGDRGNIVIWDETLKKARALEAQEVFAFACVAELSHMVYAGKLRYDDTGKVLDKVAIAVNDPTSLRIDAIAKAFGVAVFRAEVGEANVVGLARKLRGLGYTVRILGEGSAGGNITHPSAVRDPIDTVFALLKMLALRSGRGKKGLFEIWRGLSGVTAPYKNDFTLADIIETLPRFFSTGSYTPDALLKVKTADHGLLKDRYQTIFIRDWEVKKAMLREKYGITGWSACCYNGLEEKVNIARFGEAGRGGLRINFTNDKNAQTASLWMRGSGTEPIFRIMADAESLALERECIAWQRAMVSEADSLKE
jgi:phosphoglucomutase